MASDDEATRAAVYLPRSLLLVSLTPELSRRCKEAARRVHVLFSHECTLATLHNTAAECRPMVLVFPEQLYHFDAAEFEALARDVQASVVVLSAALSDEALDILLDEALTAAELRRQPEPASGRYAVIPPTHRRPKR